MVWTSPMTAVSNTALTAAQWNQHVRDNFLETAPAKATTTGQYFVSTAANAITARSFLSAFVLTGETTTATSFADLTTVGPSVTVSTGTAALVMIRAETSVVSSTAAVRASYAVSGATTIAASGTWSLGYAGSGATAQTIYASSVNLETSLNPGSNTFTMKYQTSTGTATFSSRRIIVMPL